MKFAIFGDIHGDIEALQAVLRDADEQGCAKHACLGDIVGFGPSPGACVDRVRALDCPVVRGEHDEHAADESLLEDLNPHARASLLWTRQQLTHDQRTWLAELKLVRRVGDFTIVHATLDSHGTWCYVTNHFDAMASFVYQATSVCFHGHTHRPVIYEKGDAVREAKGMETTLAHGTKYFINVGSVGRSNDGSGCATYAVYDLERQHVQIRRILCDAG